MVNPITPPAPRGAVLAALGVAMAAYLTSLRGGFLGDDFVYIARFHAMPMGEWPRLFLQEWSGGIWGFQLKELRPMAALTFIVESHLWGANALGYRVVNLLLFLVSTWMVVELAWRYSSGRTIAAVLAGLFFALHPVQVEPVTWIVGRVDLLATCAALVFWNAAERYADTGRRWTLVLASLALAGGVFSKELCLLAPALLFASWLLLPGRTQIPWARRLALGVAIALVVGAYAWCRQLAFGTSAISPNSNWQDAGSWQRQASYVGWIFPWLPFGKSSEFPAPPPVGVIQAVCGVILFTTILGAIWARWRQRPLAAAAFFFGGIWWAATILPLVLVHYFSPRHLHFGTTGLAIGAGLLVSLLPSRRLQVGVALLLCGWLGAAQIGVCNAWRDAARISREALVAFQREVASQPPGAVAVLAAPTHWRGAWLFSWSAPHLALPPFLQPGLTLDTVFAAGGNYYQSDHWAGIVAERAPAAIAQAPALVVLHVTADGRIVCRSLQGQDLLLAAAELASRTRDGITEAEWNEWIQLVAHR